MSKITDLELGWLIGILEGEGCFDYQTSNSARIRLAMTDEDTILRTVIILQKIIGKDIDVKAYMPKGRETRRKDYQQAYAIAVYAADAIKVMRLVVKYMSQRRRQRIWQSINGYRAKQVEDKKLDLNNLVSSIAQQPVPPPTVVIQLKRRV